jgi:hypothetical protein
MNSLTQYYIARRIARQDDIEGRKPSMLLQVLAGICAISTAGAVLTMLFGLLCIIFSAVTGINFG